MNTPNIKLLLNEKECKINDCQVNWKENYENFMESKKNNISSFNDKCVMKKIKNMINNFFYSNNIPGISMYSYDIDSTEELKKTNTNLTFIEFSYE